MSKESKYIIPNLKNACQVLNLLGENTEGLALFEIVNALELPQTTALRIMSTLEGEHFVSKTGKTYCLGTALTRLCLQHEQSFDLRSIAAPALRKLAIDTDETAHLAIPSGYKTLVIEVCDSPHPIRASSEAGTLAESHCCAAGKNFVAHLFSGQLDQLVAECPLNARTQHTITTIDALETEILKVIKQGYAVDDEEFYDGVRCLAAPVFDRSGKVIASIGITAGIQRFTRKRIPQVARLAQAAAAEISKQITI